MRLERAAWNEQAAQFLRPALGDDEAFIKSEVESGVSILWHVIGCGWVVTRLEDQELVFVAGVGKKAKEVINIFMKNKQQLKFNSCRIHSARVGMARYLKTLGFKEVERVYRVIK